MQFGVCAMELMTGMPCDSAFGFQVQRPSVGGGSHPIDGEICKPGDIKSIARPISYLAREQSQLKERSQFGKFLGQPIQVIVVHVRLLPAVSRDKNPRSTAKPAFVLPRIGDGNAKVVPECS